MVNLNHRQAQGLLKKAADRAISSGERISLEAHLAGCKDCRSYSNKLDRIQDDLGNLLRTRWNGVMPNISSEAIQRQSRVVARKNNILHAFATVGMVITLLAAVILAGSFVRWPISFGSLPIQQSTPTSDATGISAGSEAAGSAYLEQPKIPSPFPPVGIGKICTSTSASSLVGDGNFIWPTRNHFLAGKDFSANHPAIDISGDLGDAALAADAGFVIMAGFNTWGYGNLVILEHGKGRYTLYGHLDTISVTCGQNVYKGQLIGSIGMSGNTAKPELHFQVLSGSSFVNPWTALPPSESCDKVQYIVQSGDTLSLIVSRFSVSVESIRAENNLGSDVVNTGMQLTISLCH